MIKTSEAGGLYSLLLFLVGGGRSSLTSIVNHNTAPFLEVHTLYNCQDLMKIDVKIVASYQT